MAYAAIVSLVQTIDHFINDDQYSISIHVNREMTSIHKHAVSLQEFLEDFPNKASSLEGQIRDVVNEAENKIEGLMLVKWCSDQQQLGDRFHELETVTREMELISEQVINIKNSSRIEGDELLGHSQADTSSSRSSPTRKDAMVGFDDELTKTKERLCGLLSPKLKIIPIFGMGGIGKTTLAKNAFQDLLIMEYFDIRAWVTVSQDYSMHGVFSDLTVSMKENSTVEFKQESTETMDMEVFHSLMGRRYLIVLDDLWSTKVWDDLKFFFPDDHNGSRIMLTTRLYDVAAYPDPFSPIHEIHLLDEDQSWNLLQQKVFTRLDCPIELESIGKEIARDCRGLPLAIVVIEGMLSTVTQTPTSKVFADQNCPDELQGVGRKIVKSCGGLPLAIVRVAQLLSRIDRNPKSWEQVVATDGELESNLSLSYTHLPHHLKACFLYMAAFPEDYEICVSELIKLWVAEGFLTELPYASKSLEETAEDLLKDLVDRSLVLVTSWKMIDGKIRSCRLQNMVRDFCARQAGQERLLLPVMDYLPSPILRRHFLPQVLQNHQRLSVSWCDLDLKHSTHSSCTKSIICIPEKGYRPKGSVRNFSSLRVLHVSQRKDHSYWALELGQVFDLIHLTYLASNIPTGIVPPAISKLRNLQTLIIYRSGVCLPVEIWRMRQLRHLVAFSFDPLPHPEAADLPLENLLTLSLPTDMVCSERMVEMIPNIQKLGICYPGEKFDGNYHLNNLVHLRQLEKLKLEVHSSTSFWPRLNPVFPMKLKKLTLSGCRLPWRDMTIVGSLPNLHVLKLRNHACDGECWETTEGEFDELRLLLIDESNLQHWITRDTHFLRLKHLVLHRCPHLTEIPMEIGEFPLLELIEVDDRNQSLLNSAKMILEEQRYLNGNDDLQVRVKRF